MVLARLLESKTHIIPGKLRVSELFFEVPRDYSNPSLGSLRIFARSVTKNDTSAAPADEKKVEKPWLAFLEGGPGGACRPPQSMSITNFILDRGYQMLYLDQRGTGLSTPVTADTLVMQGDAQKQADYLKLFRADSIVKDCEAIRNTLTEGYPSQLKKWSIFGQSFGGFCAFTYVSFFPSSLREVFTSGGVPPVGKSAEVVYAATFEKVKKRNASYYERFPEDIETVKELACYIHSMGGLQLPAGGVLTAQRFLTLGLLFGAHGGVDTVHEMLLRMKADLKEFSFITRPTLSTIEGLVPFDGSVLYAILHEAIYCENAASLWAAERIGAKLDDFRWISTQTWKPSSQNEHPLYFSGEMIFPFMFHVYPELKKLRSVADIIAEFGDWPRLYDPAQLAINEVPIYAASFLDDMYVDFGLVQDTLKTVKNCKQFVTNTMYHDAIRSKTDEVLKGLFALKDDVLD